MYSSQRTDMRQFFRVAWEKLRNQQPMEPIESLIAAVVSEHPEYHSLLEGTDAVLDQDFTAMNGQTNPFLHLGMHLSIREQLSIQQPLGITAIYQKLIKKHGDAHKAEHQMMECLGQILWQSQQLGQPPDQNAYLACLKKLV